MNRKLQLAFESAMLIPAVLDAVHRNHILASVTKEITAAASWLTAPMLIPLAPKVSRCRG